MIQAVVLALLVSTEPVAKLKVGDLAPAFKLTSSDGKTVDLAEFKGRKKVVLAFFPKAFTGGCTREMSGLRDHQPTFDEANTQVFGISMDSADTLKRFAESLKLTFPLLNDRGGRTAAAYGVKGALWANRATFVIGEDSKILAIFLGKDAVDPGPTLAACKATAPTS